MHCGYRPAPSTGEERTTARRVVRRDERLVQALSLPSITLYNMRSAWAKLEGLAEDMIMRSTELCFLNEVWEKAENKQHAGAIERMFEMKGISYISTPRPGARRGGGTALASPMNHFSMVKLNVEIPKPVEACWALLKPKNPTGQIKKIICCSFYSPPNTRMNNRLIQHLVTTLARLRTEHKDAGAVLAGDVNSMKVQDLLTADPALRQVVSEPTNKNRNKTLDCIFTDMSSFFQQPSILPPIPVDEGRDGQPSDHAGVEMLPRTNLAPRGAPVRRKVEVRRLPDSLVAEFGLTLLEE